MARGSSSAARVEAPGAAVGRATLRSVVAGPVEDDQQRPRSRTSRLSAKERVVLRELARGLTTEEIGQFLHVSPHTVRTHVKNAMRKLEARTRAHAVAMALSDGVIELG